MRIKILDYGTDPFSFSTEFIRGEGMGGGVGGMVYSIKHTQVSGLPPQTSIICSHANHRGDIIARSNFSGSLTSYALYEAYGTRPYEWGTDPDRQKANTKEEETDLNLLNEGMRYRDLATGTFLTRDPIGYGDGPNIYCYVHCNPITSFDPWGLADQKDIDAMQEDINSEMESLNEEMETYFFSEDRDAGTWEDYRKFSKFKKRRKALNKRQHQLSQTQADLNNNRWGNTLIPNNAGGEIWYVNKNGDPVMANYIDKPDGSRSWYYVTPTEKEKLRFFNRGQDGSYIKKTQEEFENAFMSETLGKAGSDCMPMTKPMLVVGYGAVTYISWPILLQLNTVRPAVGTAVKDGLMRASTTYLQNAPQINAFSIGAVSSFFPGGGVAGAGGSLGGQAVGTVSDWVTHPEENGL